MTDPRTLFAEAGFRDVPALLLEAVAGLCSEQDRRALVVLTTPRQLRWLRATPGGRLELLLGDLAVEDLAEIRAAREGRTQPPPPPPPE